MIASMTGFARAEGSGPGFSWIWELRSVNGRGLELRLKLPPGHEASEAALRDAASLALKRGNVTANLALKRTEAVRPALDPLALEAVLAALDEITRRVPDAPALRPEAILAFPGVFASAATAADPGAQEAQAASLREGFGVALAGLVAARAAEGARMHAILTQLLDEIAAMRVQAAAEAADQPTRLRARLMESVAELLRELPGLPEERVAQEVALLAARADVREELDRLASHLDAARALLTETVPVGRRLEFLAQEFHREANTLCSKSASPALTATGLRLKAVIEQLREQAANIE